MSDRNVLNPMFLKEMDCPVCQVFHFPTHDEVDRLCNRHLLMITAAFELSKLRANGGETIENVEVDELDGGASPEGK